MKADQMHHPYKFENNDYVQQSAQDEKNSQIDKTESRHSKQQLKTVVSRKAGLQKPNPIHGFQIYSSQKHGSISPNRTLGATVKFEHTYQNPKYINQNYDFKTNLGTIQKERISQTSQGKRAFEFQKSVKQNNRKQNNDNQGSLISAQQPPYYTPSRNSPNQLGNTQANQDLTLWNNNSPNDPNRDHTNAAEHTPTTHQVNHSSGLQQESSMIDSTQRSVDNKQSPIVSPKLQNELMLTQTATVHFRHNINTQRVYYPQTPAYRNKTECLNSMEQIRPIQTIKQFQTNRKQTNQSIESIKPTNYVPHVQNSLKSIQKGHVNLAEGEETRKHTIPQVEENNTPRFENKMDHARYLKNIRNPRNFNRINQLNQELKIQKIIQKQVALTSYPSNRYKRTPAVSSPLNTSTENRRTKINFSNLDPQWDQSDVLSGSEVNDYRESDYLVHEISKQYQNEGIHYNHETTTLGPHQTDDQGKQEINQLTEELLEIQKKTLANNFRKAMLKAEQDKKNALNHICRFSVGRAPRFDFPLSTIGNSSMMTSSLQPSEPQSPPEEVTTDHRPMTQDFAAMRPMKFNDEKRGHTSNNSNSPFKRPKFLSTSLNVQRTSTQAQKLRSNMFNSIDHQSRLKDSSVRSKISRRNQELSNRIQDLQTNSPRNQQDNQMDESLVIVGNYEWNLNKYKISKPIVKQPEVNIQVIPNELNVIGQQRNINKGGDMRKNTVPLDIVDEITSGGIVRDSDGKITQETSINDPRESVLLESSRMEKVSSLQGNVRQMMSEASQMVRESKMQEPSFTLKYGKRNPKNTSKGHSNTNEPSIAISNVPKRLSIQGTQYINVINSQLEDTFSDDLDLENIIMNDAASQQNNPKKLITVKGYPLVSSEERRSEICEHDTDNTHIQTQKMQHNQFGDYNQQTFSNVANYHIENISNDYKMNEGSVEARITKTIPIKQNGKRPESQIHQTVQIQDQQMFQQRIDKNNNKINEYHLISTEINQMTRQNDTNTSSRTEKRVKNPSESLHEKNISDKKKIETIKNKQKSDEYINDGPSKISVQSDNYGTSAPLETISMKEETPNRVCDNPVKEESQVNSRTAVKITEMGSSNYPESPLNPVNYMDNGIQQIQMSGNQEAEIKRQDEPIIEYKLKDQVMTQQSPQVLDADDSQRQSESMYHNTNSMQPVMSQNMTVRGSVLRLPNGIISSNQSNRVRLADVDQIESDKQSPNFKLDSPYKFSRLENAKNVVMSQVKQFKIETARSLNIQTKDSNRCRCSRQERCSHRYQQEQIVKNFLKIQHEKFQQQGSSPREEKVMRPGKIKGSNNMRYTLNLQQLKTSTNPEQSMDSQRTGTLVVPSQPQSPPKDARLTPEQQSTHDFWSQRYVKVSSRQGTSMNRSNATSKQQNYNNSGRDYQANNYEVSTANRIHQQQIAFHNELQSRQYQVKGGQDIYMNKMQMDSTRKIHGSQNINSRNSNTLQTKRKSQSLFNNDDLSAFINNDTYKKQKQKYQQKNNQQYNHTGANSRLVKKNDTENLDESDIVKYQTEIEGGHQNEDAYHTITYEDSNDQNKLKIDMVNSEGFVSAVPTQKNQKDQMLQNIQKPIKPIQIISPLKDLKNLPKADHLNKMFKDFKKSIKYSQRIQEMQTKVLPDEIDEIRKRKNNQSMKIKNGNMFLKVRKQMHQKKFIGQTIKPIHQRFHTIGEDSIGPQNQTLLPLQKDQIQQNRIQYHRYLELKRLKLETNNFGTVKDRKPFKKFDRANFEDHILAFIQQEGLPRSNINRVFNVNFNDKDLNNLSGMSGDEDFTTGEIVADPDGTVRIKSNMESSNMEGASEQTALIHVVGDPKININQQPITAMIDMSRHITHMDRGLNQSVNSAYPNQYLRIGANKIAQEMDSCLLQVGTMSTMNRLKMESEQRILQQQSLRQSMK